MTRGKMNERGASAVEYGLLVGTCVLAFVLGLQALGMTLKAGYHASAPRCGTAAAAGATVCTDPNP